MLPLCSWPVSRPVRCNHKSGCIVLSKFRCVRKSDFATQGISVVVMSSTMIINEVGQETNSNKVYAPTLFMPGLPAVIYNHKSGCSILSKFRFIRKSDLATSGISDVVISFTMIINDVGQETNIEQSMCSHFVPGRSPDRLYVTTKAAVSSSANSDSYERAISRLRELAMS